MEANGYEKRARIGDREVSVSGDREYVDNEFEKLLQKVLGSTEPSGSDLQVPSKTNTVKKVSLREFLEQKKPKSQQENLFLVGYFLEKLRDVGSFTKQELENNAQEAKVVLGQNVPRDLKELVGKGLFDLYGEKGGAPAFRLTMTGEKVVEEQMG